MPEISKKKKKFIQRNFKKLSIEELSSKTGIKPDVVRALVDVSFAEKKREVKHPLQKTMGANRERDIRVIYLMAALVIFFITFSVYTPTLKNAFVWDDIIYVVENTTIHSITITSVSKMFTSFHAGNWHPLTWLIHAMDYKVWGTDPFGHHLSNIILHALNTLLVFFLFIRVIALVEKAPDKISATKFPTTIFAASVSALLFGLHPLHVESVAWVAEQKDLLCALFFLLSVLCYLAFATSTPQKPRRTWYVLCFVCAILSLLSKPMAVTLPLVLLILDVYPLKRINFHAEKTGQYLSVFREKLPFLALSITSSIITVLAQRSGGALKTLEKFPLDNRLTNSLQSLVFYLGKMIVPFKLTPYYPFPSQIHFLDLAYLVPSLLVLIITSFCLWKAKRGSYAFIAVWSYYVITILPVLGIVQVGGQAAADRYTYLPSLSIFMLCGAGICWFVERTTFLNYKVRFTALIVMFSFIFIVLGQITIRQSKLWAQPETLWSYVINTYPFPNSSPLAHNNLGTAYYNNGEMDKAILEYERALILRPQYADALNNLGVVYSKKGMIEEAIDCHKKALAVNPISTGALLNLGAAYDTKGELDKAIIAYKKILDLEPNYARAHNNLAVVYYRKGNYRSAILHCDKVVEIRGSANPQLLKLLKPYRTN